MTLRFFSNLDTLFFDSNEWSQNASDQPIVSRTCLFRGEYAYLQFVYDGDLATRLTLHLEVPFQAKLYRVVCVPSSYPAPPAAESDDDYLRKSAGLYPDLLEEVNFDEIHPKTAYLLELNYLGRLSGSSTIGLDFAPRAGSYEFELELYSEALPEIDLWHSEWMHVDCLSDYYAVEAFSEAHFGAIEAFATEARKLMCNCIYTPVFTPALDVELGRHRSFAQLLKIRLEQVENRYLYDFDFSLVERYMKLMDRLGFRRFEISHLFSQWGAAYAIDIYAEVSENAETALRSDFSNAGPVHRGKTRIFGNEQEASDPRYIDFLKQFLRAFRSFLVERDYFDRVILHISDEPSLDHLAHYRSLVDALAPELRGFACMDAQTESAYLGIESLCDFVIALDRYESLASSVEAKRNLWLYFCCVQAPDCVNRFMAMPLWRQRSLGYLLYAFDVDGFLHWGLNFYNSQFSRRQLNPYQVTDADAAFPSGDAFLLYPGPGLRPQTSLRSMALLEAMMDYRRLRYLETKIGRSATIEALPVPSEISSKFYFRTKPACELFSKSLDAVLRKSSEADS
ncbi:MAG: DUF4091 domain-containing protein [Eubacteriales bacterium]|nr:DUF4091 domain-containing protein [Eubacteriales bacterium]